jgi:heme-degrading monooxygenase HmoA
MFVAMYRWTCKPGREADFREAWRRGTEAIARTFGGLGSRLHRAEDGAFVAYAEWADEAAWRRAFDAGFAHDDPEAAALFRDAVAETPGAPILLMTVEDDLLQSPRHGPP